MEQVNLRTVMESICKRQCELIKSNAQLLDWAMKAVLGKKKVSLPQINISDYVPYIIVPQNEKNPNIPFSQPGEPIEIPFSPIVALPQDETYGIIRMSRRTPKDIEKYNREQEKKAKSPLGPKENKKN